ncbi:hypothetical protein ACIBSV_01080 [Embleya sp. NPDC050154]|uniref:hypothetical protein n=1 Tax=unclassified Embleya TaxID=2699296 RepID=UPI00379C01A2
MHWRGVPPVAGVRPARITAADPTHATPAAATAQSPIVQPSSVYTCGMTKVCAGAPGRATVETW